MPPATSSSTPLPIRPAGRFSSACCGEQNVRALTSTSGVSRPAVSKRLGVLKLSGLVCDRREGRETHYSARPQGLASLLDWMSLNGAFWRDRFDRLEDLLKRTDQ
jgi:DNA-binding transcriptional ArsR family regulator